jgi:hypothetical protein
MADIPPTPRDFDGVARSCRDKQKPAPARRLAKLLPSISPEVSSTGNFVYESGIFSKGACLRPECLIPIGLRFGLFFPTLGKGRLQTEAVLHGSSAVARGLLRAARPARQNRVSAPSPAAIEELDVAVAAQIGLQICVNDPD